MHIRSLILAIVAAFTLSSAVHADPFDTVAAPFENYYGSGANGQPVVPDFNFTKAEFGNTQLGAILHLGAEVVYATVHGYTIHYNPATDEVLVWGSTPASKGIEPKMIDPYANVDCGAMTFGEIRQFGTGKPFCVAGSSVGSADGAPGRVLLSTTPATERECTWTAKHDHSC